jgi:hypothetical protein
MDMAKKQQLPTFRPGEKVRYTGRTTRKGESDEGLALRLQKGMEGTVVREPETLSISGKQQVRHQIQFETGIEWVYAEDLEAV